MGKIENQIFCLLRRLKNTFVLFFTQRKNCGTFDDLRYILYPLLQKEEKTLSSLPSTSSMLYGHILRCHYVVSICSNLMSEFVTNLDSSEFGWTSVDFVLVPKKRVVELPEMYTVTCGCKKKCTGRCQYTRFEVPCTELCVCNKNECYS